MSENFSSYIGVLTSQNEIPGDSLLEKWGNKESDQEACIREVFEETGIALDIKNLRLLGEYGADFPGKKVTFVAFRSELDHMPEVTLPPHELQDYRWVTGEECYAMNDLILNFHTLLTQTGYQ